MVFRDGFFHADLHPGNVFVAEDGAIVAVDFGIMGRLDREDRTTAVDMLLAFLTSGDRRVAEIHFDLGFVPATESIDAFTQAIRAIGEPVLEWPLEEISVAMQSSFQSFGLGLILSTVLVYLILVAQFKSFVDPFLILLAIPTGLTGVLLILWLTGTTLNVMSLMGVVMMVGIVVSNSILIVEFTNRLVEEGRPVREAVSLACRVRLRPVLMTSGATLIGLLPMALKLGTGSEAYAPLAMAIIGGLAVSVVLTVLIVPAAYLLIHGKLKRT